MTRKPLLITLAGLLVAALAVLGLLLTRNLASPQTSPTGPAPTAAVKTAFPGLAPAQGEPDLAELHTTRPSPGQVLQVHSPFDDRLVLESLAFDGKSATGAVRVTSDVSDVLDLQVLAGFYDENGTLIGTARFVHHLGSEGHDHSGPPEEREEFSIPVPAELQAKTASAAVGVPVLVNE